MSTVIEIDPFDARIAHGATGLLREFNVAGVLGAADVHVAQRLCALAGGGVSDDRVLLGVALAVRGPRMGHVYVDLGTIATTAAVETESPVDLAALPWPEPEAWREALEASAVVACGEDDVAFGTPLRLVGSQLYLDRYWREERQVTDDLVALAAAPVSDVSADALADGIARLFVGHTGERQALAAATAVLRRLTVIAGGPGTGKTTTVARVAALLFEQGATSGGAAPLVALTAPTGKAAARLEEAVHHEAARLAVTDEVRGQLLDMRASTLHRLLGWRPDSHSRFRHNRGNRLPYDVVIVDETSMVSLSLMARLVEAIRPDARLVLVGDPDQLTSIEAGAVLGDVVGPASAGPLLGAEARDALSAAVGGPVDCETRPHGAVVGDGIVVLDRVHRFKGGIAELAAAIRTGDPDKVVDRLANAGDDVVWIPVDVAEATEEQLKTVRAGALAAARGVVEAATDGRAHDALEALGAFRILCAHRRGPHGATDWMRRVERWLADALPTFDSTRDWYVGRPLLVTENDYSLKLYNGDTGVVVATAADAVAAAFERGGEVVELSPSRLHAVDTVYAMTIHKSQGSQFGTAAVLLPTPESRVLTRELLYTAVTRASKQVVVVGTEETVRGAVARPAARASALRERLWGEGV